MIAASILLSAVYYLSSPWLPFPGSWAVKAASVAMLAVLAWRKGARGLSWALGFCAVGDALLDYTPDLFLGGLAAFLIAHVIYTFVFVLQWRRPQPTIGAVAALVYGVAFGAWLLPEVGSIMIPVAVYSLAATAMVASAFTARLSNRGFELGAVLFIISDSVLAVDRFRMPVPYAGWIIWPTYYVGQLFLATGFLKGRKDRDPLPSAAAA